MLIGLDTWSSVADLRGEEQMGSCLPILLGEPKNTICVEHHLKEAYEQGILLTLSSSGLFGSSQPGVGGAQSAPHHNFFCYWAYNDETWQTC